MFSDESEKTPDASFVAHVYARFLSLFNALNILIFKHERTVEGDLRGRWVGRADSRHDPEILCFIFVRAV